MTATVQRILEKYRQLTPEDQREIYQILLQEIDNPPTPAEGKGRSNPNAVVEGERPQTPA